MLHFKIVLLIAISFTLAESKLKDDKLKALTNTFQDFKSKLNLTIPKTVALAAKSDSKKDTDSKWGKLSIF